MQDQFRIRPRLLALAVASALAAGATTTQAAPTFLLSATANTAGSTGPGTDIMTDPPLNGGDFYASPGGPTGSLFYHTYGGEIFGPGSTQFGARVSGEGSAFFGRTGVRYTETISNVGNTNAIVGSFSFYVDSGQVGLFGAGTGYADLLLSISLNGSEVARDYTRVDTTGASPVCSDTQSGIFAGDEAYMKCSTGTSTEENANGRSYILPFSVAAGATLTLQYDIISEVSGQYNGATAVDCYGNNPPPPPCVDNGYGELVCQEQVQAAFVGEFACYGTYFNAISRSGDPPFTNIASMDPVITTRNAVPEPGSLALAAVALGGLAAARRKRREKADA